jgi:hypothetical protein
VLAGTCGYLLKDASIEELLRGIEAAVVGDSLMSPQVAAKVLQRVRASVVGETAILVHDELSERELVVLRLITNGKGNASIARDLPTARVVAWLSERRLAALTERLSGPTRRYVRDRTLVFADRLAGRVLGRRAITNKLALRESATWWRAVGGDASLLVWRGFNVDVRGGSMRTDEHA